MSPTKSELQKIYLDWVKKNNSDVYEDYKLAIQTIPIDTITEQMLRTTLIEVQARQELKESIKGIETFEEEDMQFDSD